jgi:glucokinase
MGVGWGQTLQVSPSPDRPADATDTVPQPTSAPVPAPAPGPDPDLRVVRVGIDVGGSAIKSVVLPDSAGRVAERASTPRVGRTPQEVLGQVARIAKGHMARARAKGWRVCGLGFSLPGAIDRRAGTSGVMPNLPGDWHDLPVRATVGAAVDVPTQVINDARAFTLAEFRLGAGRGRDSMVGVTLGTGLGGGIVVRGELWQGAAGFAGELGHQIIAADGETCPCGAAGCAETLVKAEVLARDGGQASAAAVFAAAARGDARAAAAVEAYTGPQAIALANVQTLVGPAAFVIGGGVADAGAALLYPLERRIRDLITFDRAENVHVRRAQLGPVAGAIGAALASIDM